MTRRGPVRRMAEILDRATHYRRRHGLWRTCAAATATILAPVVRWRRHYLWEIALDGSREPSVWSPDEQLRIIDRDTLDTGLTPPLLALLGGDAAHDDLDGVRGGDLLAVVVVASTPVYYSYVYFDTTDATRRHMKLFGETGRDPVTGTAYTAPAWRGRGIHRRAKNDLFRCLHARGVSRVVGDVDTGNTASNHANAAIGMRVCRELTDVTILNRLVVQRVVEEGRTRWRIFRM
jgi:GNAT superfamily N-acetyltransferase